MVLGPGFYFLSQQFPADYVQQAATYAVYSLSATQLFLLLIILCAPTLSPWRTLLCAVAGWAVAALLLSFMPVQPVLGLALFIAVTAFSLRVSRRLAGMKGSSKAKAGWGLLIFRGALAGLLVAIVTTSSSLLGPSLSGLIMAFPIGYTVVAVTIHQTLGAASLVATLRSALWGTGSLAGFCTTLALTGLRSSTTNVQIAGNMQARQEVVAAAQMLIGGAVMLVAGWLIGERFAGMPTLKGTLAVAYLASFGSIVAFSAYMWLLHNVRPALAGSYPYVNPVVAVLLGAWLANEHFSGRELVAMAVILSAVVAITLARAGAKKAVGKPAAGTAA